MVVERIPESSVIQLNDKLTQTADELTKLTYMVFMLEPRSCDKVLSDSE